VRAAFIVTAHGAARCTRRNHDVIGCETLKLPVAMKSVTERQATPLGGASSDPHAVRRLRCWLLPSSASRAAPPSPRGCS
jgi:hypothetical protein